MEPVTMLQDKVVIVTGIGPGLGRTIASEAARMGADLVMVSRSGTIMEEVAQEIAGHGRRAVQVRADITSAEDCATVAAQAVEAFGRIDGLVN
ncbi:MAG: hypothetical protein RIS85_455, partial [Pseudomonadota bacterium]